MEAILIHTTALILFYPCLSLHQYVKLNSLKLSNRVKITFMTKEISDLNKIDWHFSITVWQIQFFVWQLFWRDVHLRHIPWEHTGHSAWGRQWSKCWFIFRSPLKIQSLRINPSSFAPSAASPSLCPNSNVKYTPVLQPSSHQFITHIFNYSSSHFHSGNFLNLRFLYVCGFPLISSHPISVPLSLLFKYSKAFHVFSFLTECLPLPAISQLGRSLVWAVLKVTSQLWLARTPSLHLPAQLAISQCPRPSYPSPSCWLSFLSCWNAPLLDLL